MEWRNGDTFSAPLVSITISHLPPSTLGELVLRPSAGILRTRCGFQIFKKEGPLLHLLLVLRRILLLVLLLDRPELVPHP